MSTSLFSRNARNYSNTSFEVGPINLSSVLDINNIGSLQARVEIVSGTGQVVVTYRLDGMSTVSVFDRPGKHIVGLNRTQLTTASTIGATIQVIGTVRASVEVIAYAIGEDVPEWL